MGPQNPSPLEELKSLDFQVDQITDLAGLKPIFFRLDEIAKQYANDFEIQLVVGDVKQHLVNRGTRLKQQTEVPEPPPMPAGMGGPPSLPRIVIPPRPSSQMEASSGEQAAPPPFPTGSETLTQPPKLMTSAQFGGPPPMPEAPPLATSESRPPTIPPGSAPPGFGSGSMPTGSMPTGSMRTGPPPSSASAVAWKRSMWIGGLVGAILVAALLAGFIITRNRNKPPVVTAVAVNITTNPPGAGVRVNGENKCTSNCQVSLEPGNYQITAFLDGYEAAASGVAVTAGQRANVSLALEPQPMAVRIFSDLDQGKVTLDDQPPADIQDGQFVLDRVAPGTHTLKLVGRTSEASLTFNLAVAQQPTITGPISAKNFVALAVASFGGKARVVTSSGPMKLAVNGQQQPDATPDGVDLAGYQPGVSELVFGEGTDQKNVKEDFRPSPALTVFLKSDQNIGTLIIATGQNDVRVFLNNKEYARKTQRGELRIRTIGKINVRVQKDGFELPPAQLAEIKKGGETRLEFALKAQVILSSMQIRGGTPGAEVLIDQRSVGNVSSDGALTVPGIQPGSHVIELRRDQFQPKRLEREFRAGQLVILTGADVILVQERPQVTEAKPKELPPPPAPKPPPPPAPPKTYSMADFDQPTAWRQVDGVWTHRGSASLTFKPATRGTFNFTIQLLRGGGLFRGGRVRWFLNYTDPRNYALFEMDNKNFWVKEVVNGKSTDVSRTQHNGGEKTWVLQVEVSPEKIVHKIQLNGQWFLVDNWEKAGSDFTSGKFGFLIQGDDEIGLSEFKFTAAK